MNIAKLLCVSLVFWSLAAPKVQAQSDADRETSPHAAPVVVSDTVRETLPNDYLRVTFVTAGVTVTTLSKPGSLRAFATATPLYSPHSNLRISPLIQG